MPPQTQVGVGANACVCVCACTWSHEGLRQAKKAERFGACSQKWQFLFLHAAIHIKKSHLHVSYIDIYIHVNVHVSYIYIYIYIYVHTYIHIYVCIYIYVYVYVYIHVYIYISIYKNECIYIFLGYFLESRRSVFVHKKTIYFVHVGYKVCPTWSRSGEHIAWAEGLY